MDKSNTYFILNLLTNEMQKNKVAFRLVIAKYIPEIERYGGTETIKLCEELFQKSSKTIISLLKDSNDYWQENIRVFHALRMNYELLISLNELIDIFSIINFNYNSWKSRSNDDFIISNLNSIINYQEWHRYNSTYSKWQNDTLQFSSKLKKVVQHDWVGIADAKGKLIVMIESLIHMNNNRLGIANKRESEIAYYLGILHQNKYKYE